MLGSARRHTDRPFGVVAALWRLGRALIDLPDGTVTFVFTDVEGSTRLLTRMGDGYAAVLATHERVLRMAFAAHGGCEVGTQGDAFFVAFARARDAVAAAVAAQRGIDAVRWPAEAVVRVRIGVHTGEATVRGAGYIGLDVHRAARICSAGHGGQVLVSAATRALVADALPTDVSLRYLGRYALKDIVRPEHLFEVVTADLSAGFPPLRDGAAPKQLAAVVR